MADIQLGVRIGPAKIVAGSGGVRGSVGLGTHHRNHAGRSKVYDPYHQRPRVILYRDLERERKIPRHPVAVPPISTPRDTIQTPPPAEPASPDPGGHARVARAPGAVLARFELGDRLPPGVPHVTLDAVRYGLPRPPEGEIYARVRSQVLRITSIDRQITALLSPGDVSRRTKEGPSRNGV